MKPMGATNSPVNVLTWHNNVARTGANLSETVLKRALVDPRWFCRVADVVVDGSIYTQPLVMTGVIPKKNAVIFATSHDTVYAVDDQAGTPIWSTHLPAGSPVAGKVVTTISSTDVIKNVDDMVFPEIGITGTPVIDPIAKLVYLCYATKEVLNGGAPTYHEYLVALNALDGSVARQTEITASAPGTGEGGDGTTVTMQILHTNQRGALHLLNGILYIPFGSHADTRPYHGWILSYDAATFRQLHVLCTTPDGTQSGVDTAGGGVWMGGGGPATDGTDIFVSTGNGHFNAPTGGKDYGNCVLRLSPNLSVLDYFAPMNQQFLNDNDEDLGSAGVILLPTQSGAHPTLMVAGAKPGQCYVLDRTNLGGYNALADACLQSFPIDTNLAHGASDRCFNTPAYYNGKVYYGIQGDSLKGFPLVSGGLDTAHAVRSAPVVNNKRGSTVSISANGSTEAVIWSIDFVWDPKAPTGKRQTLNAYNADSLALLYSSVAAGEELSDYTKFSVPTVANGRVFVGNGPHLSIFGLRTAKPGPKK